MDILTDVEKLELIRQIEKSDFSDEQLKELIDWAEMITIGGDVLNMLFEGSVEIVDFQEGEPIVSLTPKGEREQVEQLERETMSPREAIELAEDILGQHRDEDDWRGEEFEESDDENEQWLQNWEESLDLDDEDPQSF